MSERRPEDWIPAEPTVFREEEKEEREEGDVDQAPPILPKSPREVSLE